MTRQQMIQNGLNKIGTFWGDLSEDARTMIETTDFDSCEMFIGMNADDLNDFAKELKEVEK